MFGLRLPVASAQTPASLPGLPPPALPVPGDLTLTGVPAVAATNQLLTLTASVALNPGSSVVSDIGWDFGDGETATGTAVTHAYRNSGSFELSVSVALSGTFSATASTRAQITIQDSITLQPGDNLTFASPYVPFQPPPGSPPPPAIFLPLNIEIEDGSGQPLAVSYAYDSDTTGRPTGFAHVGLALPDGFALEVLAGRPTPVGPPVLERCTAAGGRANQADCDAGISAMPAPIGADRLTILAHPDTEAWSLTLQPGASAILFGPGSPGGSSADVPVLKLTSISDQTTTMTWDGTTLAIAAPDGYAVAVDEARDLLQPGRPAVPIDCAAAEDQPSTIQCSFSALPPIEVSYSTVMQAPSGTFTLPYSDDQGPGMMTITNVGPDAAPGGAAIDVTLDQGGSAYSGSGVMRPQGTGYLLAFELTDSDGNGYLYENEVTSDEAGFSGKGLWLNEADETQAGPWTLGAPPAGRSRFTPGSISKAATSGGCTPPLATPACLPPPGLPLPSFTGDQLIGLTPTSPYLMALQPPDIAEAGEPVNLIAITSAPCCGQGASLTYQWSFGDGTRSPASDLQTTTHTWASPGVYTVAVVFTDATDVRTFALTQVQITIAGS